MRERAGSRFQFNFLLLASWVVILGYLLPLPPEPLFLCVQKEESNCSNPLGFGEQETHSALKEVPMVPGTENAIEMLLFSPLALTPPLLLPKWQSPV